MPTLQDLFSQYPRLTRKQRSILDHLREHPDEATYITLKSLAAKAGVSEVSILRLCRALGFGGFQELKEQFREELAGSLPADPVRAAGLSGPSPRADEDAAALSEILEEEASSMNRLLAEADAEKLFRCADTLLHSAHVRIFGHDGCKILADFLSHRLNHLRLSAGSIQMGNTDLVQLSLAELRPEDVVIVFSFRDYYIRARTIARYASQRGVPVILITDSTRSPAVDDSTYVFLCPTVVRASVNSFTTPVSLINILTQCVALRLGKETLEDIAESMRRVNRFIKTDTDR